MSKFIVFILTVFFEVTVLASDFQYLENSWKTPSRYLPSKLIREIQASNKLIPIENLYQVIDRYANDPGFCSEDFSRELFQTVPVFLSISKWRYDNQIDDLFYRQLNFYYQAEVDLQHKKNKASDISEKKALKVEKKYELRKAFATLPNTCVATVFNLVKGKTSPWHRKKIIHSLRKLGMINDQAFGYLEFARKNKGTFIGLEIKDYLEKLKQVKGSLFSERKKIEDKYGRTQDGRPVVVTHTPNGCLLESGNLEAPLELTARSEIKKEIVTARAASFFTKQFEKNQTLHEILYTKYTSEQIRSLASIILNASKRIESDCVSINFDFDLTTNNDEFVYVLSPMEKYRLAIRMLELDLKKVNLAFTTNKGSIRYEELVYAALETGVLKESELGQVLKFEDFWNPKNPAWKKYVNFVLSFAGTASLALPVPYNFLASAAIGLLQSTFFRQPPKKEEQSPYGIF